MPFFQITSFSIGFLEINTWYFFLVLAFLIFVFWFFRLLKKEGIVSLSPPLKIRGGWEGLSLGSMSFIFSTAFLSSLLGARLFNWLGGDWALTDFFNLQKGGLSFFGGFLAALAFLFLWSRLSKTDLFSKKVLNLAALPLALSLAVGRVGCFLINDHPGTLTNLPWGIVWPNGETRHPVALYLIAAYLFLFLFLFFSNRRSYFRREMIIFRFIHNNSFLFLLVCVGLSRLLLDFTRLRGPVFNEPLLGPLSVNQWAGGAVFFFSAIFLLISVTRKKKSQKD